MVGCLNKAMHRLFLKGRGGEKGREKRKKGELFENIVFEVQ
jgi:hypothetical protein